MNFKITPLRKSSGMTLTELLIASILVGIVMIGAVSVDYAIRRSQQNVADSSHIAIKLQTTLTRITKDAFEMSGKHNDTGVTVDNTEPVQNVCFRQDFNNNPNDDITENRWVCYAYGANFRLYRCAGDPVSGVVPGLSGPLNMGETCQTSANSDPKFLVEVRHSPGPYSRPPLATVNNSWSAGQQWNYLSDIEFTLDTCADPSLAEDPITNPCYTLTTRVSPPGVTR